jgi:hypothetical protein
MVNNRLQWYLEKHKLYNPNQSGFRKNRNTMEQCIRLENDIQKSFVNKYITVGVFIDFQKAFDMLWIKKCRTNTATLRSTILNNIYISEQVLLILTCNVLLLKKPFTYDSILPYIFRDTIFCSKPCFQIC